jgi:HK97 family phage major capsid protein
LKTGLVRGVSIGFRAIEREWLDDDSGIRFTQTEVLELSLVTIPANADATINVIKSIDSELRAASGRKQNGSEPNPAGVSATPSNPVVRALEGKKMNTFAERISAMEATRAAKFGRMEEIQKAADGRTKEAAEKEEFDTLKSEIKSIDDELVDLRDMEKINVSKAASVNGASSDEASRSRSEPVRVQVRGSNVPKGIAFVRLLKAKTNAYLSKGSYSPLQYAQGQKDWASETPEVEQILKAAVTPGTTTDTTWAAPLAQYTNLASEFVEYLRPMTIVGRIQGMRRVPFLAKFPRQTSAAVSSWVGQAKPKPATSLAFDSLTLDPLKVAGIVPISMELMKLSSPSAEAIIRDDLAGSIAQLIDHDFLDPEKAASANVSPASITNGVTGVSATGTAYSNLKADVKSIMDSYFTANITPDTVIMHQRTALALSLMETSLGNPQFPGLTMNGGTWLGMNVIVSTNVDYTEDSPQEGDLIVFLRASEIAIADEGGVDIDVSTEASIQMETAPTDPVTASTVLVSLWQHNLVGIRAERMINWVKRRAAAVQYIKAAKYV